MLCIINQCDINIYTLLLTKWFPQLIQECSEELRLNCLGQIRQTFQWRSPPSFIIQSVCAFLEITPLLIMYRINSFWYKQLKTLPAAWKAVKITCNDSQVSWNRWKTVSIYSFVTHLCIHFPRCKPPFTTHVLKNLMHQETIVQQQMKHLRILTVYGPIQSQYEFECVSLLLSQLPQLTSLNMPSFYHTSLWQFPANILHLSCVNSFDPFLLQSFVANQLQSLHMKGIHNSRDLMNILHSQQGSLEVLQLHDFSYNSLEWNTVLPIIGRLSLKTSILHCIRPLNNDIWSVLMNQGLSKTLVTLQITFNNTGLFPYETALASIIFPNTINANLPLNGNQSSAAVARMFKKADPSQI